MIQYDWGALQPQLVTLRRQLHQVPELRHELPETQRIVCQTLSDWGIPYRCSRRDSAVFCQLEGNGPGRRVLLRADMDALPVEEQTGLPFSSRHPGRMHACGHDAHAAMLLGALKALSDTRSAWKGSVRAVFQAAEEGVTGAASVVEEGVMEGIDAVFGCHIGNLTGPDIPSGTVIVPGGCAMAAGDKVILHIRGKGCHGSSPEKGVDPVTIAAYTVLALQELLAREIGAGQPAALTIGMIRGGQVHNVIPDEAEVVGSLRTLDRETRSFLQKRIVEVAEGTAALFRGSCQAEVLEIAQPVLNDPELTLLAQQAAREAVGEQWVLPALLRPNMGSEDFSVYQTRAPGVYWFLSTADPEKGTCVPHHSPRFDIDEDQLWKGSAVMAAMAEAFLAKN